MERAMVLARPLLGRPERASGDAGSADPVLGGDPMTVSPTLAATCALTLDALARLAELRPLPAGRELAPLIMRVVAEAAPRHRTQKLSRRINIHADCFTATCVWRWMPQTAEHVSEKVAALAAAATGPVAAIQPAAAYRVAWRTTAHDLLLDEISPTHLRDLVLGDWMLGRLAAHHALLRDVPGYAGVRVLTPRIPAAAVHALPDMSGHLLGGCVVCAQLTPAGAPPTTPMREAVPVTLPGPARQVAS
jgi:hypothetical protein